MPKKRKYTFRNTMSSRHARYTLPKTDIILHKGTSVSGKVVKQLKGFIKHNGS